MKYKAPSTTRIGHIHLKVSNLDIALQFYHELLGFEIMQRYGKQAVFLAAGSYHHHIGLNTWQSLHAKPAAKNAAGLYHAAILYAERKDLATILKRLMDAGYPLNRCCRSWRFRSHLSK